MKNKIFIVRMINLIIVVLLLIGYQFIAHNREQQELTAYNEYQEALELVGNTVNEALDTPVKKVYADGVYQGTGDGFGGLIEVQITIQEGNITDIVILEANGEDSAYLTMAQYMIDDMIRSETVDVDTVSGATYSSRGIKRAVENALENANNSESNVLEGKVE